MAIDRQLPISTTPGAVTGNNYMDAVQEEVTGLWDRAICRLTSVSGTNTITANVDPALTAGLINGMLFLLEPAVTNTSTTVTLNVQSIGAKTVVDNLGAAPRVGGLSSSGKYILRYDLSSDKFWIMSYIPPSGFDDRPSLRNVIDNGGFEIWQRSSIVSVAASTTAYTCDRWYLTTNANQASTVSNVGSGPLHNRSRFSVNVQRNNGQTGVGGMIFAYPLTTDECIRLRGSKVSLSFLAAGGGNWSPSSGTVTYNLYFGTGAEGKRGAGFTSESNPISGTVNLTAGGATQAVSVTSASTVSTSVTQGEIRFTWTPVGTAGTFDALLLDNLQLETADTPTEFEYRPFAHDLELCQRHYCKTFPYATAPAQNAGIANAISSQDLNAAGSAAYGPTVFWQFPVQMRVTPTITTYNPSAANANWREPTGNSGGAIDSVVTVSPHSSAGQSGVTIIGTGVSVTPANTSQTTAFIHVQASAEL